jgi:D-serine deaminase-like pyridoxal phosphate-dependent protein
MASHVLRAIDVDTPALLLDLTSLEHNIAKMASFARKAGVHLRPHSKTHKSPRIASLQLEAGAIGVTCQKLGEAEVMADAGIGGILISNQIVGPQKIQRLIELSRRADVMVAVDDPRNVAALSAAAVAGSTILKVLVEVNVGMMRCGVPPGEPALALADIVHRSPGLEFKGLMGYEGHAVALRTAEERQAAATPSLQSLVDTANLLRARGLPVQVVSSSGTGTYDIGGGFPGITELEVGSYVTMDADYLAVGVPFECALTVLATVISTPQEGLAIFDAGMKSIAPDHGMPLALDLPNAQVMALSEEAGWLVTAGPEHPTLGDKVRLVPGHGCTTINLHDRYHVVRDGNVVDIWPVAARGRSQ